jgi:hypothetical protein
MLPMGQQQGQVIDMQAMTNDLSEMLNLPELKRWMKFTGVPPEQEPGPQGMGDGPMKAPTSTRNYVRRSVPTGGSAASRSHVMQAALLGGGVNQQQQASMSRPMAA